MPTHNRSTFYVTLLASIFMAASFAAAQIGDYVCGCAGCLGGGLCFYADGGAEGITEVSSDQLPQAAQIANRWTNTASGGTGTQGSPIKLTWGFAQPGVNTNAGASNTGASGNSLISFLDNLYGDNTTSTDYTQRSWFSQFEDSFNRWSEIAGLEYEYAVDNSRGTVGGGGASGQLGVRPDVRIAGRALANGSNGGNVLAVNYFPNNGDMIIDIQDSGFYGNFANNSRRLRNVIMHEHGHGLGFRHVESSNGSFLMEPFINTSFDGPQFDDILAAQRNYGDPLEKRGGNDTLSRATRTSLSEIGSEWAIGTSTSGRSVSASATDFISIDDNSDIDYFRINVREDSSLEALLTPVGPTYQQGPQGGTQTTFNAARQSDLRLQVFNFQGNLVGSAPVTGLGQVERVDELNLEGGTSYFLRIIGSANATQFYRLDATLDAAVPGGTEVELTQVTANSSQLSLVNDGVTMTLNAVGNGATFVPTAIGLGISSAEDSGSRLSIGVNGDLTTEEAIQLSFDQDVILEGLQLSNLNSDGSEQLEISVVSGPNPFAGLSGYDDDYLLGAESLTWSTTLADFQTGPTIVSFDRIGQDDLLVRAGTVLSLTSRSADAGGFLLNSVFYTALGVQIPEPSSFALFAIACVGCFLRRSGR